MGKKCKYCGKRGQTNVCPHCTDAMKTLVTIQGLTITKDCKFNPSRFVNEMELIKEYKINQGENKERKK